MGKSKSVWKKSIILALRAKGFTEQGAAKTAEMTIQKSVEARNRPKLPPRMPYTERTEVIDGKTVIVKVYPSRVPRTSTHR